MLLDDYIVCQMEFPIPEINSFLSDMIEKLQQSFLEINNGKDDKDWTNTAPGPSLT